MKQRDMVQGLELADTELREKTHIMLCYLARALGADFGPFLHCAVPAALQSCLQVSPPFSGDV